MADIIKQTDDIFGDYYNKINDLILKAKNIEIFFRKINARIWRRL